MNVFKRPFIYVVGCCFIGYGLFVGMFFSFVESGFIPLLVVAVGGGGLFGLLVGAVIFYWLQLKIDEWIDRILENEPGSDNFFIPTFSNKLKTFEKFKREMEDLSAKNKNLEQEKEELKGQLTACRQTVCRLRELKNSVEEKLQQLEEVFAEARRMDLFTYRQQRFKELENQLAAGLARVTPDNSRKDIENENKLQKTAELLEKLTNHEGVFEELEADYQTVRENLKLRLEEFEKIAINMGIEGAKLGEEGKVVAVLAEDLELEVEKTKAKLETLFESGNKLNILKNVDFDLILKNLNCLREDLAPAGDSSGSSAGDHLESLVDRFQEESEELTADLEKISSLVKNGSTLAKEIEHQVESVDQMTGSEDYE